MGKKRGKVEEDDDNEQEDDEEDESEAQEAAGRRLVLPTVRGVCVLVYPPAHLSPN